MASKEDKYIEQLKELGVWTEAFYPAVHQLCTQERELSRVQKAWKATQPEGKKHPDFAHELYGVITQLRRDIRASRDELGLTPKALRKLKGTLELGGETDTEDKTVLGFVLDKYADR